MTVGIVTMELGFTHLNYQETGLEKHVKLAQKYSFRGLWDLHPERKLAEKIVLESPIMRYILHICMVYTYYIYVWSNWWPGLVGRVQNP